MQALLYANDGNAAPRNSFNPSLCAKNKLNLLPEHLTQISMAFLVQLTLAPISGRQIRIATAVFNQTIGFNKREDDMNGTRLEQLTGIRRDHANVIVRELETLNVLITRQGHYGKWMSINFDFEHWGQPCYESQTNDPSGLLSDIYQPLPQDEIVEFKLHVPPESLNKKPAVAMPIVPEIPVIAKQETSVNAVKEDIEALEIKESVRLDYPESIPQKLRKLLAKHLKGFKIPQQAQRLLDYFAICLKERTIRNPIAYFISLKNRLFKGELDLEESDYQSDVDATKKAQAEKIQSHLAYQNAALDLEQLKKTIEFVRRSKDCTFEEALREMDYVSIWDKATECLAAAKEALNRTRFSRYQAGETVQIE